ncbi:hypothetical protein BKA00_005314 [Actinomadura coerulea]|uniref:Uncharacterized protein n=1 Tax=Actinomadura coerulea TaxID=46159 RepID=A0A7X0L1D0_9ACTN|nr:hypothetical protein [Actinomadura coerulea]GGQ10034.1 hypothetical protein GCM10010187_27660 [Actinomadura coerulea]
MERFARVHRPERASVLSWTDPARMRTILRRPVRWGTVDTPPQGRSFTGNELLGTGGRADA